MALGLDMSDREYCGRRVCVIEIIHDIRITHFVWKFLIQLNDCDTPRSAK